MRVRDRPVAGVLSDMIEGVIVSNQLASPHSDRVRADLWALLDPLVKTSEGARDAA